MSKIQDLRDALEAARAAPPDLRTFPLRLLAEAVLEIADEQAGRQAGAGDPFERGAEDLVADDDEETDAALRRRLRAAIEYDGSQAAAMADGPSRTATGAALDRVAESVGIRRGDLRARCVRNSRGTVTAWITTGQAAGPRPPPRTPPTPRPSAEMARPGAECQPSSTRR